MSRRVAIVGSRSIANFDSAITAQDQKRANAERDFIFYHLDKMFWFVGASEGCNNEVCNSKRDIAILSGGAIGVDRVAEEYANACDIPFFLYKPYHLVDNRVQYNPRYFFTRNKQIVDNCDELIIFWDGESRGTEDVIRFAGKRGKPTTVITPTERDLECFYE